MRKNRIISTIILAIAIALIFSLQVFASGENTLSIGENNVSASGELYSFTPTESGTYFIKSSSDGDPYVYICNENGDHTNVFDDSADDYNFSFDLEAEAGVTIISASVTITGEASIRLI